MPVPGFPYFGPALFTPFPHPTRVEAVSFGGRRAGGQALARAVKSHLYGFFLPLRSGELPKPGPVVEPDSVFRCKSRRIASLVVMASVEGRTRKRTLTGVWDAAHGNPSGLLRYTRTRTATSAVASHLDGVSRGRLVGAQATGSEAMRERERSEIGKVWAPFTKEVFWR